MTPSADDLAATHAAAFTGTQRAWTAQEFSSLLDASGMILCGDAKSFVLGRVTLDEAEVLTVATNPSFQRQGRAAEALLTFIAKARQCGATRIFLEVAADNFAAKQLYQSNKFTDVGKRPKYYTAANGEKIDAVIMESRLIPQPTK